MEGWRMILLVNGGLFLFMAVSTWGLSGLTQDCDEDVETDCDPSAGISGPMRNTALVLAMGGILLLAAGLLIRRRARPPQP